MKRKIWLIHEEDEPPQGPYWSKRVAILADEAERQGHEVRCLRIDRAEQARLPVLAVA